MNIRPANCGDIERIVYLRVEMLKEIGNIKAGDDVAALEAATRKYLTDRLNKGFICWVAEEDTQLVGVSGFALFERPPLSRNLSGVEGYIVSVYVIPWYRERGIAAILVSEIVGYAKTMGIKRIWLHATDKGKSVYERLGFRIRANEMELNLE